MRIRAELFILVGGSLLLCAASVGLVIKNTNRVAALNDSMSHMRNATRDVTSQLALTQELSFYGSQRAAIQWLSLQDGLQKNLQRIASDFPRREEELRLIQDSFDTTRRIFEQLQSIGPSDHHELRSKREELLVDLLITQTQGVAEDINRLRDSVAVERDTARDYMVFASIAGSISLLSFSIAIALSLRRRVLGPLANLTKATTEFGEGNLSRRAIAFRNDELGDLAAQFNLMADRLQKQSEDLTSVNDNLESKVAERTAELRASTEEIKAVLNELEQRALAQQRLIHILSHDLREPLNGILNFTRMIQVTQASRLDEQGVKQFGFVTKSAARMKTLLDDLLKYVRLEKSELSPVPIKLDALMSEVEDDLVALIGTNGAAVTCEGDVTLQGDRSLLRLVIENLVSNGIKFHKLGVAPRVAVVGTETPTEWVVTISDNGIGIPVEDRDRIFDLFTRLHLREKFDGTGLGLAIVKQIVALHGGSIEVSSSQAGSTFAIHLPKYRAGSTEAR